MDWSANVFSSAIRLTPAMAAWSCLKSSSERFMDWSNLKRSLRYFFLSAHWGSAQAQCGDGMTCENTGEGRERADVTDL